MLVKTPEDIVCGPEVLLESREDMVLAISSLLVGCRNSLKNVYVNILFFFVISAIEAK